MDRPNSDMLESQATWQWGCPTFVQVLLVNIGIVIPDFTWWTSSWSGQFWNTGKSCTLCVRHARHSFVRYMYMRKYVYVYVCMYIFMYRNMYLGIRYMYLGYKMYSYCRSLRRKLFLTVLRTILRRSRNKSLNIYIWKSIYLATFSHYLIIFTKRFRGISSYNISFLQNNVRICNWMSVHCKYTE